MKKLLLFLLAPIVLFSCKEDTDPVQTLVGDWELVAQTNSWNGTTKVGAEMSYQQTYKFRSDGTFTKIKKMDGQTLEAKGDYTTEPVGGTASTSERLRVSLNFAEGDEIAGDCYGPNFENLVLRQNSQLTNTWSQCDGPGLTYEKK